MGELNRLFRNEPRRLATIQTGTTQAAPKNSPESTDVEDNDEDDDASSVYSDASDDTRVIESNKRVGVYDDETAAKMYPRKRRSVEEETWYDRQAWPYDIERLNQLSGEAPKHDQLQEALDEFRRMTEQQGEYRDFARNEYLRYRETQNDLNSLIRQSMDEFYDVPSDT